VKLALAIAAAAGATAIATSASAAPGARTGCTVPRLYALTIPAAMTRIAASRCHFGGISYERPRIRLGRVTDQVPMPGAVVPRRARIFLIVS